MDITSVEQKIADERIAIINQSLDAARKKSAEEEENLPPQK